MGRPIWYVGQFNRATLVEPMLGRGPFPHGTERPREAGWARLGDQNI